MMEFDKTINSSNNNNATMEGGDTLEDMENKSTNNNNQDDEKIIVETVSHSSDEGVRQSRFTPDCEQDGQQQDGTNDGLMRVDGDEDGFDDSAMASERPLIMLGVALILLTIALSAATVFFYESTYLTMYAGGWIVYLVLFAGYAWFAISTILSNRRGNVNSRSQSSSQTIVKVIKDAIVDEYRNFLSDWRQEFLMLTDKPHNPDDDDDDDEEEELKDDEEQEKGKQSVTAADAPYALMNDAAAKASKESSTDDDSGSSTIQKQEVPAKKKKRLLSRKKKKDNNANATNKDRHSNGGRPKSAVFRVLVKPFVPILKRRGGGRRRKQHEAAGMELPTSSYAPPPSVQ